MSKLERAKKVLVVKTHKLKQHFTGRISKLRCFWTRPFGHVWQGGATSYDRICAICDTPSVRGIYDSAWKYDLAE